MDNTKEDFQNYHDFAWATNRTDAQNYMAAMELKKKIAEEKGQLIYSSFLLQIEFRKYAQETTNLMDKKMTLSVELGNNKKTYVASF